MKEDSALSKAEMYEKRASVPLGILSGLFLVVYCTKNFHLSIADKLPTFFRYADLFIWLVFALDYLAMLYLAKNRGKYFRTHLFTLLAVLLPFLRIFRLARLVIMLANSISRWKYRTIVAIPTYTFIGTIVVTLIGAASVYDVEASAKDANIRTPQDALWWAAVTIFTVGYGDKYPVTATGKLYAVGFMMCGIAIVGTVTATFAGWLIAQIREVETENAQILSKLDRIEKKLENNS